MVEVSSAESVRRDEGQVPQSGNVDEGSEGKSSEDIQRKAPGSTGNAPPQKKNGEGWVSDGEIQPLRMNDVLAVYHMAKISMREPMNFRPSPRYAASFRRVRQFLRDKKLLPS